MKSPFILIDSNRGIYIPKIFAEMVISGDIKIKNIDANIRQCLGELGNPDNEYYWEAWEELQHDIFIDRNGNEFSIFHGEDLWAVPEDMEEEERQRWYYSINF